MEDLRLTYRIENRDHEFVSFGPSFWQRKMQSKFELNDLDANGKLCQMKF
jgi:hypothetical protein